MSSAATSSSLHRMLARDLQENVFGIVYELLNNHLYEIFHSSTSVLPAQARNESQLSRSGV